MATHKLLASTYQLVDTLGNYASTLVADAFVELPDDPEPFTALLNTCLVARQQLPSDSEVVFDYYEPTQSQSEVSPCVTSCLGLADFVRKLITRAQLKLLKARDRYNVLNLGFRLVRFPDHTRPGDTNGMHRPTSEMITKTSIWSISLSTRTSRSFERPNGDFFFKGSFYTPP